MVEYQWDSVVSSPYSPVLTGLELLFMGVTWSNSGLFSTLGFLVSSVGKRGRGAKKKKKEGRREKGNRKGKDRRKKE